MDNWKNNQSFSKSYDTFHEDISPLQKIKHSLKRGDNKLIPTATVSARKTRQEFRSEQNFNQTNVPQQYPLFIRDCFEQEQHKSHTFQNSHEGNVTMFCEALSKTLSFAYTIFIITVGIMIYLDDLIFPGGDDDIPYPEIFCVYLLVVGLFYFLFLYFDLKWYIDRNSLLQVNDNNCYFEKHNLNPGSTSISPSLPRNNFNDVYTIPRTTLFWRNLPSLRDEQYSEHHNDKNCFQSNNYCQRNGKNSNHYYCFHKENNTIISYVKLGVAVFCMGHLLHCSLLLSYNVIFFLQDSDKYNKCSKPESLILDLLYLLYSFVVMFFVFKFSNVIINRHKWIARFALMHCIGANLSFWVWTILRELMESMNNYQGRDQHYIQSTEFRALPLPIYYDESTIGNNSLDSFDVLAKFCRNATEFSHLFEGFIPYLCPFTVEYSIITVAVFCKLWYHIGTCSDDINNCHLLKQSFIEKSDNNYKNKHLIMEEKSIHKIHPFHYSSNKGLFAGFIVLVGCFLSVILYFVMVAARSRYMITVNAVSEFLLLLLMTIAVPLAYRQTIKLNFKKRQILLDSVLMFISLPALIVETVLSISSLMLRSLWQLATVCTILKLVQVLMQTTFVIDGLQRYSGSAKLRSQKPGRELIMLLIVCNIAFWIINVFEITSKYSTKDLRSNHYGSVFWKIMHHLSMPLYLFYRFHSSCCLVDIWKSAYENK